jgi:hypothetical protein
MYKIIQTYHRLSGSWPNREAPLLKKFNPTRHVNTQHCGPREPRVKELEIQTQANLELLIKINLV